MCGVGGGELLQRREAVHGHTGGFLPPVKSWKSASGVV